MKFYDERIQKHLLSGGKIRNNTYEGSYIIYIGDNLIIRKDNGEYYTIKGQDLSSDTWEIVEPEYDWDKIIEDKILCQFWNNNQETQTPFVGYLEEKVADGFRRCDDGYATWKNCAPVKIEQFNIAKDLKDYEK